MPGTKTTRRWIFTALCLMVAAPLGAPALFAQSPQVTALREGNRQFREGRLEDAYATYFAGYDTSAPHPILAYNLGTAAHHLGRLPEAILWYRRADTANPGDPWLRENLETARATLGLQPYSAPGIAGSVSRHSQLLYYLGATVAWIGVALWMARSRSRLAPTISLLAVAVVIYGGTLLASRQAPRPAVVVDDCSGTEADLPEGSEVWIVAARHDTVELAAGSLTIACPADSVAPILAHE